MTEVVTISAATAAFAAEPLKPSARLSGSTPLEETIQAWSEKASASGDPQQKILMNLVHPPALALFFLTTSQDQRHPQLTPKQAEEEYKLNSGETESSSETTDSGDASAASNGELVMSSEPAVSGDHASIVAAA
jgi:hypothetical protein